MDGDLPADGLEPGSDPGDAEAPGAGAEGTPPASPPSPPGPPPGGYGAGWGPPPAGGGPSATPPGWGPPPGGGWATPGWGQPPTPPGWGQPAPPAWGQPTPSGWGQGPTAYPPPSGSPWGQPSGGSGRRRALTALAAVLGAVIIAAAVAVPVAVLTRGTSSSPSAGPSATPTPESPAEAKAQALYRQVFGAADQSAGFQYVATTTTTGSPAETITGVAGQKDGTQEIVETTDYGDEKFYLRLTSDGTVYVQGNVPALEDQLGFSQSTAQSVGNDWVKVVLADGPYNQLWEGITVDSQMQEYTFEATSTATVQASGGPTATRIRGNVPAGQFYPDGATAYFDVPPVPSCRPPAC